MNHSKASALVLAFAVSLTAVAKDKPLYLDTTKPLDERVEDALSRMTTADKIKIIHAQSKFCSSGVPSLGIPELWTTDGPHGIRPEVKWDEWDQAGWTNDSCVAFPALTCLAATWNPEMAHLYGVSIGEEARFRGKDVLLGPGCNIYRTPLNGRNFEYLGEDPYLAGEMVSEYVRGVQENGVAACVKHYALNNNEHWRSNTNVIVDDRTLYEIYLPAFKAAVQKGGAWAIMGAYNLYDNQHLCHNDRLLNKILKGEWGFDGAVISDWGGVHNTRQAITNGMDLEFGTWTDGLHEGASNAYDSYYLALPYLELINKGEFGTEELDDKARRVLRLMMRTAMDSSKGLGEMCSPAHYEAARRIGDEGIVLLRNEGGILPLGGDKPMKILVVGENALKKMTVGGGSSSLKVQREISPIDGLRAAAEGIATIDFARGYVGDVTGSYNGVVTGQNLEDNRSPRELIDEAVAKAADADCVIFIGGLNKSDGQDAEGCDRTTYALPYGQDDVITALAKANPNLVVVNISGNAVAMPWADKVPAIVQAWFIGSEAGNAIADVIFGKVNPSGKLPFSFPVKLEDVGAHSFGTEGYPGIKRDGVNLWDINYKEGVLVGYRWLDTKKIKPRFAFGHGLSYTDFKLGKLTADRTEMDADGNFTLSIDVTNTGSRPGAEVVQLYISENKPVVLRPAKELKGFKKVALQPGETKTVTFTITKEALSYFDADAHRWVAKPGQFTALAGTASDDIRSSLRFKLR